MKEHERTTDVVELWCPGKKGKKDQRAMCFSPVSAHLDNIPTLNIPQHISTQSYISNISSLDISHILCCSGLALQAIHLQ